MIEAEYKFLVMMQERFPRKITIMTLLGTKISITPNVWQYPFRMMLLGWLVAWVFNRAAGMRSVLLLGVVYGLLITLSYLLHTVGHILSAREVDAPMTENVLTGRRQFNIYADVATTPQIHIGRAIGGPLMNLTLAVLVFVLWAFVPGWGFLIFALANLIIGVGSLLPIRGLDGGVIWRGLV